MTAPEPLTPPELLEKVQAFLRSAGLLPEKPPTDPKERALWLKKRRNTGPEKTLNRRER